MFKFKGYISMSPHAEDDYGVIETEHAEGLNLSVTQFEVGMIQATLEDFEKKMRPRSDALGIQAHQIVVSILERLKVDIDNLNNNIKKARSLVEGNIQ